MDIAIYSIKNKVISWMLVIIFLVGGIFSYTELSRLEDPEFTSKNAVIVTQYPGASPQQVEEEVTLSYRKCYSTIAIRGLRCF